MKYPVFFTSMPRLRWDGMSFLQWVSLAAVAASPLAASSDSAAIVLENESVRVVIEPQLGRVMEFAPKTDSPRNVLWVNSAEGRAHEAAQAGYENWGGDKVWPVPQPFWRYGVGRVWPPDEAADGSLAAGEGGGHKARLVFPVSEHFHVRLEREFELDASAPILRIRNRITQMETSPFPAQGWSITQVPLPERVLLDVADDAHPGVVQPVNFKGIRKSPPLSPEAFAEGSVESGEGWVRIDPRTGGQQKLGTLGRWIAGVWADGILLQSVAFNPEGMYPEATSLQLYHNDRYAELETLGAARLLQPGESMETVVLWEWLPPVEPEMADAALAQHLTRAAERLARYPDNAAETAQ